ncbi:MAG: methyltransferase [Thiotrichales bacterium]|nr:methyltransferase [Thiotrichales bacterium]
MTWRDARVAPSGTHHVRGGAPLYAERFDEVLKFHEPGLAAVRHSAEAWHIRVDGTAAYDRRFHRTFGFYEGLAAVFAPAGWRHIRPDGTDLYPARFAWCGNFQGGRCAVREFGGSYLHLTPEGVPAYGARWRYAGDFRDRLAVVQSDIGRSTHIDPCGKPVHGGWFLDLDVFHKGCARARDEDGWMHVDLAGHPLYRRRFAAVEPFYNGQARVERLDGGLEVIDETGARVVELRPALKSAFAALSDDLAGFWRTQAICAAVELGVFEVLPATAAEIAEVCGLEPTRAKRLLRALAELRLVAHEDGGRSEHTGHDRAETGELCAVTDEDDKWRATERGACLTAGHPWTLVDAAVEYGRMFQAMWEALPRALRVDSRWRAPDIFAEVAGDPARVTPHHRMLTSYARHDYAAVPPVLGLRGDERVLDAGGGFGVLAGLLAETCPDLRITVLDRAEVVERAVCERYGDRVRFRAVDLFGPWGIEGDAVILARVLHDWDDGPALRLLRHARHALPTGGQLFVVEMVLVEGGSAGGLCDLHLLVATGGRERTTSEYATLFDRAGFAFHGVRRLPALPSVVVGVAR